MNPIPTQIYTIPTPNPIPLHMNPNPESNPDSDSDSSFDSDSGFGIAPGLTNTTIVILDLVLRPSICHQYIFLDIQMIGTCRMRLVCRFCCWPTSQCQTCTGYRTWYHEHDRDDGRQAQGQSSRARPRPGKHVFVAYKNPFIFAVFECTN